MSDEPNYKEFAAQVEGLKNVKVRYMHPENTFYSACGVSMDDRLFFNTGSYCSAEKALSELKHLVEKHLAELAK